MITRVCLFLVLAFSMAVSAFSSLPFSSVPSDADIRRILAQRIDTFHQGVGIVVGVIDPAGRRIVAYGSMTQGDPRPLNGDTIFEIGSVSKVFTSLLLADMIERREVALNDPISKYLPASVKAPEHDGRSITLFDLATHASGLTDTLVNNFHPKDPENPYVDYTAKDLYAFLSSYKLTRDPGAQFEYSNLGGGLLGHLLSLRSGTVYEALVHARITGPLSMTSTGITLTPGEKARLAVGHNTELKPVANWDFNVLAGAGALRSSANDLLTFLAAFLGYKQTLLAPAMASMLAVRRPAQFWLTLALMPTDDIGLAWIVAKPSGIVWHTGGTGGYRSFAGFDSKTRVGVVVLSNTFTTAGVDDIGMHLLDPQAPLMVPPKEISVDPKIFDGYVGRYQLVANFVITITREGDALFAQANSQPRFQIFPEGPRDFFPKVVNGQITFETDTNGRATGVMLHQDGNDAPATRIGDVGPPK
jgi:serine-type D-Ala-D-Ala carboxypeptidase/endopeptidase